MHLLPHPSPVKLPTRLGLAAIKSDGGRADDVLAVLRVNRKREKGFSGKIGGTFGGDGRRLRSGDHRGEPAAGGERHGCCAAARCSSQPAAWMATAGTHGSCGREAIAEWIWGSGTVCCGHGGGGAGARGARGRRIAWRDRDRVRLRSAASHRRRGRTCDGIGGGCGTGERAAMTIAIASGTRVWLATGHTDA